MVAASSVIRVWMRTRSRSGREALHVAKTVACFVRVIRQMWHGSALPSPPCATVTP